MSVLWSDLRFAVRGLMKARGFSIAAITALALGIGPNTAIFSVVYATLLAPLPFPEPHQLVMVWSKAPSGDRSAVSPADYLAWKESATSFQYLEPFSPRALQPVDPRRAAPRTGASRHTRRASDAWRGRRARPGFPARGRSAGEEPDRAAQQPALAPGLRCRSRHRRPRHPHGRTALLRRRRVAAWAIRSPACGPVDAAHVRARRDEQPCSSQAADHGPPEAGRQHRTGPTRDDQHRRRARAARTEVEQRLERLGRTAAKQFPECRYAHDALAAAGRGGIRRGDCVCERGQPAARARLGARARDGDPRVAGR